MKSTNNSSYVFGILPTVGIILFVGLYAYSASLYPGGSQADLTSAGFDWVNNYWCNLLNEQGMNNQANAARPFAIAAMLILCLSLMLFFVQFARKLVTSLFWKAAIQLAGVTSMAFAMLIFTKHHDIMTMVSSVFGALVVIGIIWEVSKSEMTKFKVSGIVCVVLLAVNNYIYYSHQLIEYLPLIQKITFVFVLSWIISLNVKLIDKSSN